MERLRDHGPRALLAVLRHLDGTGELAAFPSRVLPLIRRLVPCEIVTYNDVNPRLGRLEAVADPPGSIPASLTGGLTPYMHEHPLISYYRRTGDGRAVKLSDFVSQRQFHQLGMYQDFYRKLSVERQLAFTLPAQTPRVLGIALNREGRDFTEGDRALLELLRPHLVQAYETAALLTTMGRTLDALARLTEEDGAAVAVLHRAGSSPLLTARARRWVAAYFGRPDGSAGALPEPLAGWVAHQRRRRDDSDAGDAAMPLVTERAARRLVVRFVRGRDLDEPDLLLFAEQPAGDDLSALLTPREHEVLTLLAQGETNQAIGACLGMSRRTVEKHLEHVFGKLGVTTRTAAAAWAIRHNPQP